MRGLVAAVLGLAVTACAQPLRDATLSATSATPSAPSTIVAAGATRVFALLANNHLLVADLTSGEITAELTLGSPGSLISQMHAIAIGRDGTTVFVLVSGQARAASVAAVDIATLKVRATFDPGGDLEFRGLAVGPRTGRLYLFANQGGDAVVRVLDPTGAQAMQTWPARTSGGRSWLIYQGAIASDESALYLSYHGPDTTGIDRFEIQNAGLLRCAVAPQPESGCFRAHGSFALRDGELIAATGEAPWLILDPVTGARRGQFDVGLEGNHLMEFGIAAGIDRLYAVGSCGYTGGLASVDLATLQTHVLIPSRTRGALCGERLVAQPDGSRLVVAVTKLPVPSASVAGGLAVVTGDGTTLRTIKTSAEPIDLLLF